MVSFLNFYRRSYSFLIINNMYRLIIKCVWPEDGHDIREILVKLSPNPQVNP